MIRALVRALVHAYFRASYGCWRARQCLYGVFAQTCEKIHNGVSKARQERKRTRKIQAQCCTVGNTDAFLCADTCSNSAWLCKLAHSTRRSWKCKICELPIALKTGRPRHAGTTARKAWRSGPQAVGVLVDGTGVARGFTQLHPKAGEREGQKLGECDVAACTQVLGGTTQHYPNQGSVRWLYWVYYPNQGSVRWLYWVYYPKQGSVRWQYWVYYPNQGSVRWLYWVVLPKAGECEVAVLGGTTQHYPNQGNVRWLYWVVLPSTTQTRGV